MRYIDVLVVFLASIVTGVMVSTMLGLGFIGSFIVGVVCGIISFILVRDSL